MSGPSIKSNIDIGAMQSILDCPAPEAIRLAGTIGFDGLELGVSGPAPEDHRVWSKDGREQLAAMADENDIQLPSLALNFLNDGNVSSSDPDDRERARDTLTQAIEAAADLDMSVVLVPFFVDAEISTNDDRKRTIEGIRAVADTAESAGVTLALENTLSAAENLRIREAIESPAVEIYYDVSNATWWGHEPVEEIKRLDDRIAQVHFKDGDGSHSNAKLGAGHVDYKGIRGALGTIGYEGWIVLETMIETDPVTDAADNLEFARELL